MADEWSIPDAPADQNAANDAWKVLIHNDEKTPFEYVIQTLESVFMLSEEIADHIAWTAHDRGTAVVVIRPRLEAEALARVARGRAQTDGYPLQFTLEKE